jgi:hypothetical protein
LLIFVFLGNTAFANKLSYGIEKCRTLNDGARMQYFKVGPGAVNALTFDTCEGPSTYPGFKSEIAVMGSDCRAAECCVAGDSSDCGAPTYNALVTFCPEEYGVYYVAVYNYYVNTAGEFTLTVSQAENPCTPITTCSVPESCRGISCNASTGLCGRSVCLDGDCVVVETCDDFDPCTSDRYGMML